MGHGVTRFYYPKVCFVVDIIFADLKNKLQSQIRLYRRCDWALILNLHINPSKGDSYGSSICQACWNDIGWNGCIKEHT